jgi:SAM-dependent methyltransferase
MYDFEWHKTHGDQTIASANVVVPLLKSIVEVSSVLDVGCGDGRWLACFQSYGVSSICGVDGAWTDQSRLLIPQKDFKVQDLSKPFDLGQRFEVAICLEVAEHVASDCSMQFIENLTKHSDIVLFGAAIPFQGGFRHINERWQSYWVSLFDSQGYKCFDPFRSQIWQREEVLVWYRQNMLLYVRRERQDLVARIKSYLDLNHIPEMPIDVVHPARYEAIASYSQIAFKPLMRKLPKLAAKKLADVINRRI